MEYPEFYDEIPPLVLRDPLADFLGAVVDGVMEVRYLDVVRLVGHSCPTVAGAWLMAQRGLAELYGADMPLRGGIEVQMRDQSDAGVCGVIASVLTLITGAAGPAGFHGLAGQYDRRNLLTFGRDIAAEVRLVRKDTGRAVTLDFDHASVPADPEMMPLMQKGLAGTASPEEKECFQELWQGRVRAILLDQENGLVTATVEEV